MMAQSCHEPTRCWPISFLGAEPVGGEMNSACVCDFPAHRTPRKLYGQDGASYRSISRARPTGGGLTALPNIFLERWDVAEVANRCGLIGLPYQVRTRKSHHAPLGHLRKGDRRDVERQKVYKSEICGTQEPALWTKVLRMSKCGGVCPERPLPQHPYPRQVACVLSVCTKI